MGEDKANDIKDEYNENGTVTVTNEMVDTIGDNGYDGVINNDTGEVTVVDNSNVSTVTEEESVTDETVVATRPEWKNEMDAMYNTYGGISIEEDQKIAEQYGVPLTEFGDYYKEMVQVNQPWKQAILDNYLMNGRVDFDTIKKIEQDFGITTNEFYEFYKKLSIASADGFDAGILDAFESEIEDLGGTIEVLEGQLDTAQDAANWDNGQLDAGQSRDAIINTLKTEGGFSQTEAARLFDSISGFRDTISGLEGDVEGLETDVDNLTKDRDFAEGAYQVVDSAWAEVKIARISSITCWITGLITRQRLWWIRSSKSVTQTLSYVKNVALRRVVLTTSTEDWLKKPLVRRFLRNCWTTGTPPTLQIYFWTT